MSKSDKDIESLVIANALKNIDVSADVLVDAAGGRLTESRIDRIQKRVVATLEKLSARFVKNIEKRGLDK